MRRCGDCQLCCKLLPVQELRKGANQRCKFQRVGKGCTVYGQRTMPGSCSLWTCRWLAEAETTGELSRPDRSHYVIDAIPDYVHCEPPDGGEPYQLPVLQIWVDPLFPDAHRDPALRRYLAKVGEQGLAALIRFNASDAFVLFPPAMTGSDFVEHSGSRSLGREHTASEVWAALDAAGAQVTLPVKI